MKATVTGVSKRVSITPNKTEGILNYDEDNAYPQRMVDIVNSSGVATACVNMKTRFLIGGGMKDKDFYKAVINRKRLTVDKLARKVASNLSYLPMVALHVNYNALYQKTEVSYIPFSYVRLTTSDDKDHPNMVAVYEDWQKVKKSKIDKARVDYINLYNPDPAIIQEQVDACGGWQNYKGQVYFWAPEGYEYPLATYDSVLEDMQTDSKAKAFKFRNITTNFMGSHAVVVDKFENEVDREAFQESLAEFQGADDALKLLLMEKSGDTSSFEIKPFDIQDVEDLYSYTETSVRDNVILNFLIPPVLLVRTSGTMGTAKEIKDATAYYNGITADERLVIEEIFKEVFTGFATNINPSGDYSIIPFKAPVSSPELTQEYFPYVTKNQILESLGLPEVTEEAANVKPMYEALGVGGLQAMSAMIADPLLTRDQKLAQLEIVYRVSKEQAELLVGKEKAA